MVVKHTQDYLVVLAAMLQLQLLLLSLIYCLGFIGGFGQIQCYDQANISLTQTLVYAPLAMFNASSLYACGSWIDNLQPYEAFELVVDEGCNSIFLANYSNFFYIASDFQDLLNVTLQLINVSNTSLPVYFSPAPLFRNLSITFVPSAGPMVFQPLIRYATTSLLVHSQLYKLVFFMVNGVCTTQYIHYTDILHCIIMHYTTWIYMYTERENKVCISLLLTV